MSCGCTKPEKAALWTPIPEYRQPTDIQVGENIDCYMKRAGNVTGQMDDAPGRDLNRINNTSVVTDNAGVVNTAFQLTTSGPDPANPKPAPNDVKRTATSWTVAIDDGTPVSGPHLPAPLTELSFALSGDKAILTGTVAAANLNKMYRLMITAIDATGTIDAREFNFFPKITTPTTNKDGTVKFTIPLDGDVHVTSVFGPRTPPAAGASSIHKGMDFARKDHSKGNIVAAADGTVVRCGPGTGWGNVIFIEHPDANGALVATTVYGHWSEAYVKVGQKVALGQKIALEGNVGIGSAMHLHFELHKGKFGNPTDPAPYLAGASTTTVADTPGNAGDPTVGQSALSGSASTMTSAESTNANAGCPMELPADKTVPKAAEIDTPADPLAPAGPEKLPKLASGKTPQSSAVAAQAQALFQAYCDALPNRGMTGPSNALRASSGVAAQATRSGPYTAMDVYDAIWDTCIAGGLNEAEANFILTIATIESSLNFCATNPTSSATGLFQMLNSLAASYFSKIQLEPSMLNRCDPIKSTKAMIKFFQNEFKTYYNGYLASGKVKIAGKAIQDTDWSAKYKGDTTNFTMGEFMYGLIHHDGVGSAVNGKDLGGVDYWRKKVGTRPA